VEHQIGLVAEGKADKGSVVAHTVEQFRAKFLFFVSKVRGRASCGRGWEVRRLGGLQCLRRA
jgi:hypothetical protein